MTKTIEDKTLKFDVIDTLKPLIGKTYDSAIATAYLKITEVCYVDGRGICFIYNLLSKEDNSIISEEKVKDMGVLGPFGYFKKYTPKK